MPRRRSAPQSTSSPLIEEVGRENPGVDPGIHGGLAIVAIEDGAAPQLVDAIDIPVAGIGAKERVDVLAIRNFIDQHTAAARA